MTRVDMLMPPGFTSVDYENVPGWSAKTVSEKVSPPIETDEGPVSEEVGQVVWTWQGPLGPVQDRPELQQRAGGPLDRPALTAEHPSPRINVTTRGGAIEDVAGAEAGPEAGHAGAQPATATTTSSGGEASQGLAIAALIVGALGLLAGVAALLALRRRAG